MITLNYNLDILPNKKRPVVARLSQDDEDFTMIFTLYASEGTFVIESGTTARIAGTLTNGDAYAASGTLDIENKTVTIAGDADMTAASGYNVFELELTKGEKVLHSANFEIWVEPAAYKEVTTE